MIWLLNDIELFAVVLKALALALEALLLGGAAFLVFVVRGSGAQATAGVCRRGMGWAAVVLLLVECAAAASEIVTLVWNGGVTLGTALGAPSLRAHAWIAVFGLALALVAPVFGRKRYRAVVPWMVLAGSAGLLASAVSLSHAASRLDHRPVLLLMTALHHIGTGIWLGAMPYLLLALPRTQSIAAARTMAQRYSAMALTGAGLLVGGGVGLAWFYVGPPQALYGTGYGLMLLVKVYLLFLLLALGASNWFVVRRLGTRPQPLLARLARFAEVEIGLAFLAILAAASLTSQPPAVDLQNLVTAREIKVRFLPQEPRMHSPPLRALAPSSSIEAAVQQHRFGYVTPSDTNDIAWSEYNHHWAGLILLLAGGMALLSRFPRLGWARFWPVSFAGLALLILLRADAESWPLGPRPFWKSFSEPDVLEHRLAALLLGVFSAFECAVQTGRVRASWARLIFPASCIVGAALLLTHSHGLENATQELLEEISHTAIALLGLSAGWARWLELRLPEGRSRAIAGMVWPPFLMLAGLMLLDYREA